MLQLRRIPAAAVAVALVLAACGGEPTPTQPEVPPASTLDGPLVFTLSPQNLVISRDFGDPPPEPVRLQVGGLIAIGGYPQFGNISYGPEASGWLQMTTQPNFSRDPLAWNFDFSLTPAGQALPLGVYTATIPVAVTAASNSPQSLSVTYVHCGGNCLVLGSVEMGELSFATSSTFDPDDPTPFGPGVSDKMFQEWRLFVLPGQTVYLNNRGLDSGSGTLTDPYLYAWTLPGDSFYGSDDDNCTLDSEMQVTNSGSSVQEYRIYASHFGGYREGTYQISVNPEPEDCGGGATLRMEPDAATNSVQQALQEEYNRKHGISN